MTDSVSISEYESDGTIDNSLPTGMDATEREVYENVLNRESFDSMHAAAKQAFMGALSNADREYILINKSKERATFIKSLIMADIAESDYTAEDIGVEWESTTEIEFSNGSRILFRHDEGDQLRGYHPEVVYLSSALEELHPSSDGYWNVIHPMTKLGTTAIFA